MNIEQLKLDIKKYNQTMSDYQLDQFVEAIKSKKISGLSLSSANLRNYQFTASDMLEVLNVSNKESDDRVQHAFSEGYSQGFNAGQEATEKLIKSCGDKDTV